MKLDMQGTGEGETQEHGQMDRMRQERIEIQKMAREEICVKYSSSVIIGFRP